VCGARCPCKRRERRLTGRALAVGVMKDLGGLRCLTMRDSVLLSVWVDPPAQRRLVGQVGYRCAGVVYFLCFYVLYGECGAQYFSLLLQLTFFFNIVALWLYSLYISYVYPANAALDFFLLLQFTFL